MQQILDEMIEKIETLSDEEVNKISDALTERKNKGRRNNGNLYFSSYESE